MQVTITQPEIEKAIRSYITSIININEGMEVTIQIRATRGEDGTTALIDINPPATEEKATEPAPVVTKRTPKVEPKEEANKPEEPKVTQAAEPTPTPEVVQAQKPEPVQEQAPASSGGGLSLFDNLAKVSETNK